MTTKAVDYLPAWDSFSGGATTALGPERRYRTSRESPVRPDLANEEGAWQVLGEGTTTKNIPCHYAGSLSFSKKIPES
jgi:hypothetical protein